MKKIIYTSILGILCIAVAMVFGCRTAFLHFLSTGNHLSKEEIFALVEENQATLLKAVQTGQLEDIENINGIRDAGSKDAVAFFDCGGYGMGSETGYYGFYYTPDDIAKPLFDGYPICYYAEFLPEGNGYAYNEVGGDNRYYAEKITDGFYYYEMHF